MKFFPQYRPSFVILGVLISLIGIGIIMIYSASSIYAEKQLGNEFYFLTRQLIHLVVGLVFFRIAIKFHYLKYKQYIPILMFVTFVLLILVLIPGIGKQVGNARRWIRIGGIGFQPSELLKITLIIWAAGFLERKKRVLGYFSQGILPSLIVISCFCLLLILQPDFGTSVLIAVTLLLMVFVAGVKTSHMVVSFVGLSTIGFWLIISKAYRMRRIMGFLDPWADPLDSGFQLIQSMVAYGTGGLFGRNLGDSRQKLFFLPESHTVFIFSILAEETGFIGVSLVILLLVLLMIKGFEIAVTCPDDFGRNLAFGVTIILILQSFFNIGVVIGLLPTKGIPLPFISYGGSSLIVSMFMVGILLNISKYCIRR